MRIRYLDNVRAICMVWIVGIWHLSDYCGVTISNPITSNITYGVLGAFTFLSGAMLGGKKIRSREDTLLFYKRRFLRIYPLFAISCTSLLLLNILFDVRFITDLQQYFLTMLGISIVFTPAPGTIWYISMLLLFYAITPFLLYKTSDNRSNIVFKSTIVYGVFLVITLTQISHVDERCLYLFPIYCAGLVIGKEPLLNKKFKPALLISGGVFFIALCLIKYKVTEISFGVDIIYTVGVIAVFIVFILEFGKLFVGNVGRLLEKISYASMCAYLFHRQIYGVFSKLFGSFSFVEAVVSFFCVLIICYGIQLLYDWFLKKIGQ